jgi:hypothetical protein
LIGELSESIPAVCVLIEIIIAQTFFLLSELLLAVVFLGNSGINCRLVLEIIVELFVIVTLKFTL